MLSRNSLILSALAFCTLPLVEYVNAGCPGGMCKKGQKATKKQSKKPRKASRR